MVKGRDRKLQSKERDHLWWTPSEGPWRTCQLVKVHYSSPQFVIHGIGVVGAREAESKMTAERTEEMIVLYRSEGLSCVWF